MTEISVEIFNILCVKFYNMKAVVIDEGSMMGSQMLNNVNRRFRDIFRIEEEFGWISIFVFGEFRQLPPVGDTFIFFASRVGILGQIISPPFTL